jgi:hypothetical protein
MAVGDVVAVVSTATSWRSWQPASGVEIILTQVCSNGSTIHLGLSDGTDYAYTASPSDNYPPTIKLAINNTIYLQMYSANTGAWSGIQIK